MQNVMGNKDIRDYILSKEVMTELRKTGIKKKEIKKAEPKVTYRVILQAGCDFIVEKEKEKKVEQLVILVSQKQYYIQTVEGERQLLKVTNLRMFLKDVQDEIRLPEVTWLSGLKSGKVFARDLIKAIRYDSSVNMIRRNIFYLYDKIDVDNFDLFHDNNFWSRDYKVPNNKILDSTFIHRLEYDYGRYTNNYQDELLFEEDGWGNIFTDDSSVVDMDWTGYCLDERNSRKDSYSDIILACYSYEPTLYVWLIDYMAKRRGVGRKKLFEKCLFDSYSKERKVIQSYFAFLAIEGIMGKEWAKNAVIRYMNSAIEDVIPVNQICGMFTGKNQMVKCNGVGYYRELCSHRKFKADSFFDYLFEGAVRQGFADDLQRFLFIWNDVLTKQEELDGKIKEKYPKQLVSLQCKLAYDSRKYQSRMKEKKWDEVVRKMQFYEYKNERYQIICPKNVGDLVEESRNQHNCVNGYEDRIIEGKEMVLFMRENENPERSLVTIELFNNGDVGQVFGRCNKPPLEDEMKFIREWARAKKLKVPSIPLSARA